MSFISKPKRSKQCVEKKVLGLIHAYLKIVFFSLSGFSVRGPQSKNEQNHTANSVSLPLMVFPLQPLLIKKKKGKYKRMK